MRIETSSWGNLEITEEQIYHFNKGLPGFDEETEFALISLQEGTFSYMQSLKEPALAFLLTEPFDYYSDYEFELSPSDMEELEIKEQVLVRCIITLKESIEESTINLLAPVILNPEKQLGKQVVLHNTSYQTRHPLWIEELQEKEPSGKEGE
ncbi:flagellar assembly protein FliW [Paenibacillus pini]|uniref:Flagellar assembly factor FliW n=1 Tax=Paenibacillus pini JCM 16418 TaxID=1236976 RepID=W7Z124_9BACL|nr:flagellar assembly protein FliW [Paenibacillus pini]GAF10691.1 flagellar assembly factor FliW [Paenibacillus pini JCM 16418]